MQCINSIYIVRFKQINVIPQVITEFSENNPVCVGCGLQLVQNSNPLASKLGLHLLEQFIRYYILLHVDRYKYCVLQLLYLNSNLKFLHLYIIIYSKKASSL